MATYVIGDVHGQFIALERLLKKLCYHESRDELWFVGDLVNRGPDSLEVLQFVESLGKRAKVVLGNHDFSLLVQSVDDSPIRRKKSTREIMSSKDGKKLLTFLRCCPLVVIDNDRQIIMVHAGCYPFWTLEEINNYNQLICEYLCSTNVEKFLQNVYQDEPYLWHSKLSKMDKARFIVNTFTRMRFIDKKGRLDLKVKVSPEQSPKNLCPWYILPRNYCYRIVFGHWATLGLNVMPQWACIDGGAAWGGELVAFDLDRWKVAASIAITS